jgi:DNA-damage-inducible protein D
MAIEKNKTSLRGVLESDKVRRAIVDGETLYAAVDVIAILADTRDPVQYLADLKVREPVLADVVEVVDIAGPDGEGKPTEAVRLDGVLRVVQSIPSARAERIKKWLARTARERLDEAENPELAVLRTRKLYEHKGYSPRWIDKRLRGISARHELTGEWYKRGATDSEQYRELTNEIMRSAFGLDVECYRRYKNLFKTGENLRDHMTDLELALVALAETVSVNLHRERGSNGFHTLVNDARDAGEIVAKTRGEIESRSGKPVLTAGNHRAWWMNRRTRRGTGAPKAA